MSGNQATYKVETGDEVYDEDNEPEHHKAHCDHKQQSRTHREVDLTQ